MNKQRKGRSNRRLANTVIPLSPRKNSKRHERTETERNGKQIDADDSKFGRRRLNMINFLFDSAFQVVTWVGIAFAIAAIFYFLSRSNLRGVLWSSGALLCAAVIMLVILADRYFFRDQQIAEPSEKPAAETSSERNFRLANQQWLDTRNWSVRLQRRPEGFDRLDLSFELWNPTSMAVTLKKTTVDTMSIAPFVPIPVYDPAPQITSMVDTTANEFIDTGIPPGPQHIRVPLNRNPDPKVERYSGDPKHPFQSKLDNSPPTGSPVSNLPARRRGETILQGHVLAPGRFDLLSGGWYDLDTPDKTAHYQTGRLRLSLTVTIEYIDAFNQPRNQVFLIQAAMGRHSGHVFSIPTAIDHMPGRDVFGRTVEDEARN